MAKRLTEIKVLAREIKEGDEVSLGNGEWSSPVEDETALRYAFALGGDQPVTVRRFVDDMPIPDMAAAGEVWLSESGIAFIAKEHPGYGETVFWRLHPPKHGNRSLSYATASYWEQQEGEGPKYPAVGTHHRHREGERIVVSFESGVGE